MGELFAQRYRLEEELRRGRLTTVFRATDLREANRAVIVKILEPAVTERESEATLRFLREARILSKLDHPHLVELLEVGQEKRRYYLVTRYVDGRPLSDYAAGRRLPVEAVLKVAMQITQALEYVHNRGIIHRDIKPSNVIVSNDTRPLAVKVADFGLARLQDVARLGPAGDQVVGTFAYIAPEQAGILPRPVDERADLYSLGVLLYELLAGQRPFRSDNLAVLLHEQLAKRPPSIRELCPETPQLLEEIVFKLMAKGPEDRYPSAASLLADLV